MKETICQSQTSLSPSLLSTLPVAFAMWPLECQDCTSLQFIFPLLPKSLKANSQQYVKRHKTILQKRIRLDMKQYRESWRLGIKFIKLRVKKCPLWDLQGTRGGLWWPFDTLCLGFARSLHSSWIQRNKIHLSCNTGPKMDQFVCQCLSFFQGNSTKWIIPK